MEDASCGEKVWEDGKSRTREREACEIVWRRRGLMGTNCHEDLN